MIGRISRYVKQWLMVLIASTAFPSFANDEWSFISNEHIRLGVMTNSGACIAHFSEARTQRNLLNHHDKGRFIQQSYYGVADGSMWNKKPWHWNPVQGGDWKGNRAKLLAFSNHGTNLYSKSVAKHWASGADLTNVIFEQAIALRSNIAHVHFKMTYSGTINHPPVHQELPAVFIDYDLPNMAYYKGNAPWTDAPLTRKVPGWPNEYDAIDENWVAYVDDRDWGVGVYVPGTSKTTNYRFKGPGGENGSGCSYVAPIRTFAVTAGMVFEYDVYLTIGNVKEIRSRFENLRNAAVRETSQAK